MLFLLIYLYKDFIFFNVLYFALFIDFILLSGVIPLIERKYLSTIQRRVGPSYIGYKGRLQFLADAFKVFLKEFIYLNVINSFYYFFFPICFFILNLFLFVFFFVNNVFFLDLYYYLIYVYCIFSYSNILLFLIGFFVKNKYSFISSNRIVLFIFSIDFLFAIVLMIAFFNCTGFHIALYHAHLYFYININVFINIFIYILLFLIHVNKAPFDMFEAESELVSGYFIEYSGFMFGLFVLIEYFHLFFFAFLLTKFCVCLMFFIFVMPT